MGISHDIDSMLKAAKLLSDRKDIKFLFIGEGEKWQPAYDYVAAEGLTNVKVIPFQSEDRLPFTMALGDVSLVALDKGAEGLMVPVRCIIIWLQDLLLLVFVKVEMTLMRHYLLAIVG